MLLILSTGIIATLLLDLCVSLNTKYKVSKLNKDIHSQIKLALENGGDVRVAMKSALDKYVDNGFLKGKGE